MGHINDVQKGGKAAVIMSRHLDIVGDGTGLDNVIADYTVPQVFKIAPAAGEIFRIERMIGFIQDGGNFTAEGYGGLVALTNGIALEYDVKGSVVQLLEEAVVSNAEWGGQCFDTRYDNFGAGDNMFVFRWTFSKAGGPIILNGDLGEEIRLTAQDNFTGLVKQKFLVQGLSA